MDFDIVESMSVKELTSFLRLRGLKINGRKKELVARVWCAIEQGIKVVLTAEQVETELKNEYSAKLIIDGNTVMDPLDIDEGWMDEDEGLVFWPMILYPDIYNYLCFHPTELPSKDLSDYKNSKAYSYYKTGWLQTLKYHKISEHDKHCILKSECRKSEKISDPFHKLWIIIEKSTAKIRSAHCTCMAGMSQVCNHVAAALFRIEAAVRLGLTNPACTSLPNEWLPNRKEVKLVKVKDMDFSREDFGNRGKSKRLIVASPKKKYNPLQDNSKKLLQLSDIAEVLKEVMPNSIVHQAVATPEIDLCREMISSNKIKPSGVLSVNDVIAMSKSKFEFYENLKTCIDHERIQQIQLITRGQNVNKLWFDFRKNVITASKAHEVKSKMSKHAKGAQNLSLYGLHERISGRYFTNPDIPALKYGRVMEVDAANAFADFMKSKHKNFEISECGVYLDKAIPFIGASPDRVMTCSCCEPACVEIKCPISINYMSPENANLPYMDRSNGKSILKHSHKYYTQCQMQMGVTGMKLCYFMVWTPHGKILDEVNFDASFYENLKLSCEFYYDNFYLDTIF